MKRASVAAFLAILAVIVVIIASRLSPSARKGSDESTLPQAPEPTASTALNAAGPTGITSAALSSRASRLLSARAAGLLDRLTGDAVERKPQIDKLIEGLSTAERVKALDELWSEDATGARRELSGELLRKWAHEMPQAAAEWLGQKPAGPMQRGDSRAVAIIWANQNASEAAGWVRQWPDDEKEAGLVAVAYEMSRTSPKDALWLASELNPSPARNELIAHAVREWASNDASLPVAWAEKMENSSLREQVFASAAISLSETDPVGAANLALQKLSQGARQDDTVVSIVQRWAQSEPRAAADWVVQFPQGQLRDAALENLVQLWTDKDAEQSAGWLNRLEDGPVRDVGLAAYARKLAPSEPEIAMTWVETIGNPELREREIESLVTLWMQSDRQAASNWVHAAGVSDEIKARVSAIK